MEETFTPEVRERIRECVWQTYSKAAVNPEGNFRYPTGRAGLEGQRYDPKVLELLPEDVLASYCGVGNPFSLGPIGKGESVLDIGCGAGVDTFVAALTAGATGRAAGIDFTPEMIRRARENLSKTRLTNVSFEEASAEALPFPDQSFDAAISNGVFNLIPDKLKALKEVLRVLKPGGRFMIADQVLTAEQPNDMESLIKNWAR